MGLQSVYNGLFFCQTTRLFRTQIIIQTRPFALRQKFQIKVFDSSQLEIDWLCNNYISVELYSTDDGPI